MSNVIKLFWAALFVFPLSLSASSTSSEVLLTATGSQREYLITTDTWKNSKDLSSKDAAHTVIYILDADQMFPVLVTAAKRYLRVNQGRPTLFVGVGYGAGKNVNKERALDFTPNLSETEHSDPELPKKDVAKQQPPGTGGATAFRAFLLTDLKPYIAKRYSVDTNNEVLFGHSYGGLFTLNTLFSNSAAFDRYIAASPSAWFGDGYLLNKLKQFQPDSANAPDVYISVGEFEEILSPAAKRSPKAEQTKAMLNKFQQVKHAKTIHESLSNKGVDSHFRFIAEADHIIAGHAAAVLATPFALGD